MTIIEQILTALLLSTPDDLRTVRKYIHWLKVRRQVYNRFYASAHWVQPQQRCHWVGR